MAMKRLLLLLVLVVVLIGVLAAPVSAGPTPQSSYPPTDVPIIFPPWGDGAWVFAASMAISDISIHQASYHGKDFKPIPSTQPVIVVMGWLGSVYGQVQGVPNSVPTSVEITGPNGFHQYFGPEETAKYWTGPHEWDAWWDAWFDFLLGPGFRAPDLFNPSAQAGVYWNHLYLPVGPFPATGIYHFHLDQWQALPIVDLIGWFDIFRPYHYTTDDINWSSDFDFYVK
jgi:hypothetical protein